MQVEVSDGLKLLERFRKVRASSESICKPLEKEDYVVQPVVDVSPPKWHLAHVTWFFETFILEPFYPDYRPYHPDYSYVFNSYYETVGKRVIRAHRGNLTRPSVEDVYKYRVYVDEHMESLLKSDLEITRRFLEVFEIGLQHEQQHQELLITDIKYILGHNPLFPAFISDPISQESHTVIPAEYISVPAGNYPIGHTGDAFCFDNELGAHQVYLHDFKILSRLVTNSEYQEFIQAGGYQDFRYWLSEGWDWVNQGQVTAPLYWHQVEGKWHQYNLRGLEPVIPELPVTHISYFEADAYARWKGMRLPTEFEWETACRQLQQNVPGHANFQEDGNFQPLPGNTGNLQFYGDAWEWTSSAYLPYPYFKTQKGALGEYNGKFMINQMVLRGGSCATPRDHIRASYRNFFHPHLRWQFNGIRLAANQ